MWSRTSRFSTADPAASAFGDRAVKLKQGFRLLRRRCLSSCDIRYSRSVNLSERPTAELERMATLQRSLLRGPGMIPFAVGSWIVAAIPGGVLAWILIQGGSIFQPFSLLILLLLAANLLIAVGATHSEASGRFSERRILRRLEGELVRRLRLGTY